MNTCMNYLWYTNVNDKKSPEVVHQILAFGTLEEIKNLIKVIGIKKTRDLFLKYPKKIYTSPILNLIKNFILHIPTSVDEKKYLKYTPRHIR